MPLAPGLWRSAEINVSALITLRGFESLIPPMTGFPW